MIHVKTNIERPDADALRRLAPFSSITIHEAQGRKGALSSKIKPTHSATSSATP